MELDPGGDQPDLPLYVIRAVLNGIEQESNSLIAIILSFIGLSRLDVDLPVKLTRNVLEHIVENSLKTVESLQSHLLGHFFV